MWVVSRLVAESGLSVFPSLGVGEAESSAKEASRQEIASDSLVMCFLSVTKDTECWALEGWARREWMFLSATYSCCRCQWNGRSVHPYTVYTGNCSSSWESKTKQCLSYLEVPRLLQKQHESCDNLGFRFQAGWHYILRVISHEVLQSHFSHGNRYVIHVRTRERFSKFSI